MVCTQDPILFLLELGSYVALRIDQGLLAGEIIRYLVHLPPADLVVVAEDAVETHLEVADAGGLPFLGFQGQYVIPPLLGRLGVVIQFGMETGPEYTALCQSNRWFIDQGF